VLRELVDGTPAEPSDAEVVCELVRFVHEIAHEMGPERSVGWLRKFYGWYLRGRHLGRRTRAAVATASTLDEVERILLEACPEAAPLVAAAEPGFATAEDAGELLDLPISLYAGG
jgi:tRNA-dihydrouridine synthase